MAGEQEQLADEPSRLFLAASYVTLVVGGVVLGGLRRVPAARTRCPPAFTPSGSGRRHRRRGSHVLAAGGGGGFGQLLSVGLLVVVDRQPAARAGRATGWPAPGWPRSPRCSAGCRSCCSSGRDAVDRQQRAVERSAQLRVPAAGRPLVPRGRDARRTADPRAAALDAAAPGRHLPGQAASRQAGTRAKPAPKKSAAGRTAPKGGRRR